MKISKLRFYFKKILQALYSLSLQKTVNWLKKVNFKDRHNVYVINGKYVHDLKLDITKNFKDDYSSMVSGDYENFIYDNIKDINWNNKVIWDIGAHFGYHSFVFANLVGALGKVYAFEPNTNNIAVFQKNINLNKELSTRIFLKNCAISNSNNEKVVFRVSPYNDGPTTLGGFLDESFAPTDDKFYDSFEKINVNCKTIDQLALDSLELPDLIKIDVEGAEIKVLQGGMETIKNRKPVLIIEIHNIVSMAKIADLLKQIDYTYRIIDEDNTIFTKNILAVSK